MKKTETEKHIFLFINSLPPSAERAVRKLSALHQKKYKILLLKDSKSKRVVPAAETTAEFVVSCDFDKQHKLTEALHPYREQLIAVTCRAESNIARFIKVIPELPYLRTPSTESLVWATDKYEMRKRFRRFDPKHTPQFTLVAGNTQKERSRIIEKVGFPMVIKPTSLASSALVSICYHEEELEKTLRSAFRKIRSIYKRDNRIEPPKLMAEEFIEGQMYSIDSYVNARGGISHCPMVRVKTGKDVGHDDFYNYLRITPTSLKPETVAKAHERVEIGIKALGLRSTTTHTELFLVDGDWKIIEIGPRIGGNRQELHELSCDIDHSMNDLLIRMPRKPIITKKCKGFAAMMRYYAGKEGYIESVSGIKKIAELESTKILKVKLKVGDRALFAKNGGPGIFDLTLYNKDRAKLLADIRRVEQMVEVRVVGRSGPASATKKKPTKAQKAKKR